MFSASSTLGWLPALFDIAVISVDCAGTVLECSEPAVAVLTNGGLSIREGKLMAQDADDQELLLRMIQGAKTAANKRPMMPGLQSEPDTPRSPAFVGAIHISRVEPLPPLQIVATTVESTPGRDANGYPAVMLFLCDPARQHSSRSQVLRSLYRLTPTEIRLIDQLVSGAKLKRAAVVLNLTENTARFHLKEIFRKMRVDCQSALLSTILLLPSAGDVATPAAYVASGSGYGMELGAATNLYSGSSRHAKSPQGVNRSSGRPAASKVFA